MNEELKRKYQKIQTKGMISYEDLCRRFRIDAEDKGFKPQRTEAHIISEINEIICTFNKI